MNDPTLLPFTSFIYLYMILMFKKKKKTLFLFIQFAIYKMYLILCVLSFNCMFFVS
jgi:hypothetical protein